MEMAVRKKYTDIMLKLIEKNWSVTVMESCTGGLIASLLTDTEGASAVMKGSFVTYSNEAKIMQGVPAEVIEQFGVYSKETASAMAHACRKAYCADLGIGVTGSFGNVDPANEDSVPGEVFFAVSLFEKEQVIRLTIPAQPSRSAYKLYVADRIADCVKGCL